ncbi:MAG: Hsp70 family protein, partial [Planctomycetes bacterium]|nr:Hsp70 family protein [Planctomycetota bacterium]
PQIEVTFDIDANGILNVSAKDLGTGKEQKIEIKSSSGLSEDEVERMVKDAEAHADDDKKQRKLVDLRNQADQLVYATEKTLKEHGDKVDAAARGEIEQAINQLKEAQKTDDATAIEKAIENVTSASHKIAEAVYKATPPVPDAAEAQAAGVAAGGENGDKSESKDEDVIDAEFEVKE